MGQACHKLWDQPRPNPKLPQYNICSEEPATHDDAQSGKDPTGTTFLVAPNFCVAWTAGKASLPNHINTLARDAFDDPDKYNDELIKQINDFRFNTNRNPPTQVTTYTQYGPVTSSYSERVSDWNETDALDAQFCNNIGDTVESDVFKDTEWTVQDQYGSCHYNDARQGYATGKDLCCKTACSIAGTRTRCVRQNFRADPLVCCFNDYDCDKTQSDNCFQTPERQRTCHPNFRDLSSSTCRGLIYDYCVGNKLLPTQTDWLEMWLEDSYVEINSTMLTEAIQKTIDGRYNRPSDLRARAIKYPGKEKQPCLRAIARSVTNSKICSFEDLENTAVVDAIYDSDGFQWSKKLIEQVFKKYQDEGGNFLGGINTDGLNRQSGFQNTFWKICNKIPGLCTDILLDTCKSYTSDEVAENPNLWPWCSCYLKDSEYNKYTKYDIQRECSPLCNRDGVIPLITTKGQTKYCLQNVCLLDSITVKLINTDVPGAINFNQICGSCGDSNINQRYHTENNNSDSKDSSQIYLGVKPPDQKLGIYTSVYGNGYEEFSKNSNEFPPCYVVDEDFYNKYKDNLSNSDFLKQIVNYPAVKIYIASDVNNDYGIYDISSEGVKDNSGKLKNKEKVILNIYKETLTDGSSNFRKFTNKTPANPELILAKNPINSKTHSKSSSKSGQAENGVSVNRCSCIVDGDNYSAFNSKIFGNINFNTHCDKLKCYNNNGEEIACSSDKDKNVPMSKIENILAETRATLEKEKYSRIFIIFLGIAIILFIMEFFKFILNRF